MNEVVRAVVRSGEALRGGMRSNGEHTRLAAARPAWVRRRGATPSAARRLTMWPAAASVALFALLACCAGLMAAETVNASMNAYYQSDFTDVVYQKITTEKVIKVWKMPASAPKAGSKAVVQAAIGRDGKLINALLTMKSGTKEWDEAGLEAVKKAAPFDPLPKAYKGENLQVHFHFNVLP